MNIKNYNDIKTLAKKYQIAEEDVLFIALNRYGIKMDCPDNRIRFYLQLNTLKEEFFFAVCVNTCPTPFLLKDKKLYLDGEVVGSISRIEKDTCTSTYFRHGTSALTVNSNSRSQCAGCKFCGTYNLDSEDNESLTKREYILNYFEQLLKENKIEDMSNIFQITVCTGCFKCENDLVDHLILLNNTLKELKFNGMINYIGSQLRSPSQLERIKKEIGKFSLYITTEKFVEREKIMRPEKASLTIEKSFDLADTARSLGFTASFLYILGLEDLEIFEDYLKRFKPHINKFPDVQIYQDYTADQENYRCLQAKDFEYYLKARQIMEKTFADTSLSPRSWENYRSLFYTTYNNKPINLIRK